MSGKIYLVRHGQTMFNQLGKVQGWADSPLTQSGLDDAQACGIGLRDITFMQAYSSDLKRAEVTRDIIVKMNGSKNIEVYADERIREMCFGDFEGLLETTRKEGCSNVLLGHVDIPQIQTMIQKRIIGPKDMLNASCSLDTSGYAEDYDAVMKRSKSFIDELIEIINTKGGNILVVTHGVTLSTIIDAYPGKKLNRVADLKNCCVTEIAVDEGTVEITKVASMEYVNNARGI